MSFGEAAKRLVRELEARVTPRTREIRVAGKPTRFVHSVWWDNTEQSVFDAEILPYLHALERHEARYVVDAGAATGHFSVALLQRFPDARIVAFEPSRRQRVLLRRNIALNAKADAVRVQPAGLWKEPGEVLFRTHGELSAIEGVSGLPEELEFAESVPMVTLDAWWRSSGWPTIDLLKMDIEGAELEALEGADAVLSECGPRCLIQAYHIRDGARTFERCAAHLERFGYACRESAPASGLLIGTRCRPS